MRTIPFVLAIALCFITSGAIAQIDTSTIPLGLPTSGDVQSQIPAATTGTAPIDSNTPSGTGTTGTSGTTMEEAAENNSDGSSLVWAALLAVAIAAMVVYLRKRKRQT